MTSVARFCHTPRGLPAPLPAGVESSRRRRSDGPRPRPARAPAVAPSRSRVWNPRVPKVPHPCPLFLIVFRAAPGAGSAVARGIRMWRDDERRRVRAVVATVSIDPRCDSSLARGGAAGHAHMHMCDVVAAPRGGRPRRLSTSRACRLRRTRRASAAARSVGRPSPAPRSGGRRAATAGTTGLRDRAAARLRHAGCRRHASRRRGPRLARP